LAAKLRRANIDAAAGAVEEVARIVAQIRRRWPLVRILLRADSGFARAELMAWCEANGVHFLFGLAKTDRLIAEIKAELEGVAAQSRAYRAFRGTSRAHFAHRAAFERCSPILISKMVEGSACIGLRASCRVCARPVSGAHDARRAAS
jgi:hypothetical protein